VSGDSGTPLGDQVTSKVEDLASEVTERLFDTANGLDRLRQVIISDYGRLQALGPVVNDKEWSLDKADTATRLTAAARAFYYSELMPIPYGVYALIPSLHTPSRTTPTPASTRTTASAGREHPPPRR
jgi:hypothetical protein